jgi:excisionase family DNA binding protein
MLGNDHLFRARQVAEHLGFTTSYIYLLIKEGKLKGTKVGDKAVRISESALREYLENQNTKRSTE